MSQTKAELIDAKGDANFDSGTLYVDATNNRVGIGTTSVDKKFVIAGDNTAGGENNTLRFVDTDTSSISEQITGKIEFYTSDTEGAGVKGYIAGITRNNGGDGCLTFGTGASGAATEKLRLDDSGRLLVGTSTAVNADTWNLVQAVDSVGGYLVAARNDTSVVDGDAIGGLRFYGNASDGNYDECARVECNADGTHTGTSKPSRLRFLTTADGASSPTERMRISDNGTITFNFTGANYEAVTFSHTATYSSGTLQIQPVTTPGSGTAQFYTHFADKVSGGTTKHNVVIGGALSKGSGSFRIPHPLKPETHELVHSFIEGPQADLIYRGHIQLVNGTATVNIDEAARMTEGTFEALCTNVCCFTSNESDWTAVRGSVSGNILTIEAQDPTSTAEVCWMVIGERKDPHMIETDWTDENGRVVTEPLKAQ